ncbi:MAG: hypothetical protein JO112_10145 [Planctomycetes bacterium]|nr:hypothetical protein [Planctomycetota bacterium]
MIHRTFLTRVGLPLAALLLLPLAAWSQGETTPSAHPAPAPVDGKVEQAAATPPVLEEGPPPSPAPTPGPGETQPKVPDPEVSPYSPGGFASILGPPVGHLVPRADYRVYWFPDEGVKGQPTDLGYVEQNFSASVPVWQNSQNDWALTTNVRSEIFHTGAILPNTVQSFPDDLWSVRFGTAYRHLFDNDWIAGGGVSVGTASDKPFGGHDAVTVGLNTFLRLPQGEHNAWLFSLNYSSNSELPFPIPGVAYVWQPSEDFRANIGLPFQLWYRPMEDLTLDFSYMLLRTVHARATYRLLPRWRVYTAFDWSNESYYLAERPSQDDRFFYYDKRLTSGVQWILARQASLDFFGGYVFDRFYFEGRSYSDRNFNRMDVGNGPFVGMRLDVRF